MVTDEIERTLEDVLQSACQHLGCNAVVLYRLDRTLGYTPVLWTSAMQDAAPPYLSSASDVSAFVRAKDDVSFTMRAGSFRDGSIKRGFNLFGVMELFVCPLDTEGPGTYILTFGASSPFERAKKEAAQQISIRVSALLDEFGDAVSREAQRVLLVEVESGQPEFTEVTSMHLLQSVLASESFDRLIELIALQLSDLKDVVIERNKHVLASLSAASSTQERVSPLNHFMHLDFAEQTRSSFNVPAMLYPSTRGEEIKDGEPTYSLVIPLYGGDEFLGLLSIRGIALPLIDTNRLFIATASFAATYLIRSHEATRSHTLQRALTSVENERRRMAIDLHDETSQNLVALTVHLATAQRAYERGCFDDAMRLMEDCQCIADGILTEVNRLSSELRSSELTYLGLKSAIEGEARKRLPKAGIAYHLTGNALERRFNALQETMLLKGVVEALSNCVRHARASEVSISLDDDDTWFSIEIADDGIGFDDVSVRHTGDSATYGMKTMYDCAEALGGVFWIGSSPGEGTTIRFSIPDRLLEEDDCG